MTWGRFSAGLMVFDNRAPAIRIGSESFHRPARIMPAMFSNAGRLRW